MKRKHIIFKGRVQGVGFRYTAQMLADKYDLTGNVKNLDNGDVEVFLQGSDNNIINFLKKIDNEGFIRVSSKDIEDVDIIDDEDSFKVEY